ncbi:MAG: minor capsid protein [Coriobacteriales bacterium]|jgi:hypothetical protein|nr:minor capsid protein [Coriobacteriales bacterium]
MTLTDIKDWLHGLLGDGPSYYVGVLDRKRERSIGVYQLHRRNDADPHVGGGAATMRKCASILVHWDRSASSTEAVAQTVHSRIREAYRGQPIGPHTADYVRLLENEPIDVGQDDAGVFERVINIEVYYRKEQ